MLIIPLSVINSNLLKLFLLIILFLQLKILNTILSYVTKLINIKSSLLVLRKQETNLLLEVEQLRASADLFNWLPS